MTENTNIPSPLLEVTDLNVEFNTSAGPVKAVRNASFNVYPGQWVAIVGESGSGKSTSAMAALGLLAGTGHITSGSIKLEGEEISGFTPKQFEAIRGSKMGLVPQDPMSNLNPVHRIERQIKEALVANNVDIKREKRIVLTDVLELSEREQSARQFVKGDDDELFLGSAQRDDLIAAARAAGGSAVSEETYQQWEQEWIPGSVTRWLVLQDMVTAGISEDKASEIVTKYVIGSTMSDRIAGLLDEAGMPDAAMRARQYPHEYSGGMRQRALIAMGLAARPRLLIADEPTSALDVTVQKKILDHLHDLTDSLGTAVLFITHDLGLAAERAQHIVVMYKGQVVESGPSLEVLQHPQHPYTKRLVSAAPSLASKRMESTVKRAEVHEEQAAAGHPENVNDTVISVKNLVREFKVPGRKEMFKAVDDVSFDVKRGTTLAIVGESGSGKSTVANMVLHLLDPTSGNVTYEGEDIHSFDKKQLLDFRRHVQPVFQNPYGSLDPTYTIFRSIEEPLRIHKIGNPKSREARVRELLDMVEMPQSVMSRYPNELSGGQRQRIAVARAMALNPDVIVADEAVSALDVLVQDQVLHLLNDLQAERGLTYLFITHDLAVVRQIADDVVVMQHGKLVEHASTDEVFNNPQTQYTCDLLDAIPGGKLELGLDE